MASHHIILLNFDYNVQHTLIAVYRNSIKHHSYFGLQPIRDSGI